jgi:transcription antitermination factor NusG
MTAKKNSCAPTPDYAKDAPAPISSKDWDVSALGMPGNSPEIKIGWGGRRPGAGRKPKPIAIPTYAPDLQHWCVVAYWGQAEISATRELTRQGYETYTPLVAIRRLDPVIRTLWHTVRVPWLPGYGFIRLTHTESRVPILETRGVREILLRPDGRAGMVRDAVIEDMRRDDDARLLLPPEAGPVLPVGATVRIEAGALLGHAGWVLECDGVRTRVEVTVFGRPTPVWLDRVRVVEIT